MFPIIHTVTSDQDGKPWPKSIPWALVAKHKAQAERNHGQTLERLAERGGLDPCELWCVLNDKGWGCNLPGKEESMAYIVAAIDGGGATDGKA